MKTFASIVVAFIAALIYAFILGYTQDSVHPTAAFLAIETLYFNLSTTFVVSIVVLVLFRFAHSFGTSGTRYYVMARKTIDVGGKTYRTLESLEIGEEYSMAGTEDRTVQTGSVAIALRIQDGFEAFLIPEGQAFGLELGYSRKDRDTAAKDVHDDVEKFRICYSPSVGKLVLIPLNEKNVERATQPFINLEEYKAQKNAAIGASGSGTEASTVLA